MNVSFNLSQDGLNSKLHISHHCITIKCFKKVYQFVKFFRTNVSDTVWLHLSFATVCYTFYPSAVSDIFRVWEKCLPRCSFEAERFVFVFFVYHVGGCAQLFTFHAFEKVGFGNFRTFPFQFRLFFFQGKKTNQFWFWRFKKFMVAHDKGDAWVKRMIITSDKSSSVFFEFPIRFVGLVTVFSGNWNVSLFFFGYCRAGELVVSTQMSTWECIFVTRKQ